MLPRPSHYAALNKAHRDIAARDDSSRSASEAGGEEGARAQQQKQEAYKAEVKKAWIEATGHAPQSPQEWENAENQFDRERAFDGKAKAEWAKAHNGQPPKNGQEMDAAREAQLKKESQEAEAQKAKVKEAWIEATGRPPQNAAEWDRAEKHYDLNHASRDNNPAADGIRGAEQKNSSGDNDRTMLSAKSGPMVIVGEAKKDSEPKASVIADRKPHDGASRHQRASL